jgi:hypothetical protein
LIPFDELGRQLAVRHGEVRSGRVTLYSVMRNERFFLEAFFDHYRRLGVEQFLILDDGSSDGSIEYLGSQPDCAVLASPLRYGEEIEVRMPDGRALRERAGVLFKRAIPERYCRGEYALYADADEFLLLPPGIGSLGTLFQMLEARAVDSVVASLVEFYPASIGELAGTAEPRSFDDLVALYPYFDALPLVRFRPGMPPKRINGSASRRLFARYGLVRPRPRPGWLPGWLHGLRRPLPGKSATMKTPILRWREGVWTTDTLHANVRPSSEVLLVFAHFKFTHAWASKTEEALRLRSYAGKSEKYELYSELMRRMQADDARFTGPASRRYGGPGDLVDAGLLQCSWTENPKIAGSD